MSEIKSIERDPLYVVSPSIISQKSKRTGVILVRSTFILMITIGLIQGLYSFEKIDFLFFITFFYNSVYGLENKIIIASTTSTYDTGLMDEINNKFNEKYNIQVQVLALGTGQAIRAAIDGNAELLLVHHTQSELEFMNKGYGIIRYELMYNDFVLVGPKDDTEVCNSVLSKFRKIYDERNLFISRGDDSGTNKKELELWLSLIHI